MGVCLSLQTITDETFERLLKDPPMIWRLIAPDDDEAYLHAIGQTKPPGFLDKIMGRAYPWPPEVPAAMPRTDPWFEADLDQSWDGLGHCLRPLLEYKCPHIFSDGTPVGDIEIGYGPGQVFSANDVDKMAHVFTDLRAEHVLDYYNPKTMDRLYLGEFWTRGDQDCHVYLAENFTRLRSFLLDARAHTFGCLLQYT